MIEQGDLTWVQQTQTLDATDPARVAVEANPGWVLIAVGTIDGRTTLTYGWPWEERKETLPPEQDIPAPLMEVDRWLNAVGLIVNQEVNRLWPEEQSPGLRMNVLAEEVGELTRAITKRRHAFHSPDGTCKDRTVDEWTDQVLLEMTQVLAVVLGVAQEEGFNLVASMTPCLMSLRNRKPGS